MLEEGIAAAIAATPFSTAVLFSPYDVVGPEVCLLAVNSRSEVSEIVLSRPTWDVRMVEWFWSRVRSSRVKDGDGGVVGIALIKFSNLRLGPSGQQIHLN